MQNYSNDWKLKQRPLANNSNRKVSCMTLRQHWYQWFDKTWILIFYCWLRNVPSVDFHACQFPTATHSGCLFHFTRSVHLQITSLGLGVDYAQTTAIREQCKQLLALSLMPVHEVERQFNRIRTISSTLLDDPFTYFDRHWINGSVPLSMWNFYDLKQCPNNVSEGNEVTPQRLSENSSCLCFSS